MANPNNNKNFNDEALRINRVLKKDNDLLKEEIEALWIDLTGYEKRITELKEEIKALKTRETIRIPISEFDFQHELERLVFGNEEFQWGAFHTVETEREIDVEFIPEVHDYERSEDEN
jgi:hypothetical protein